MNLVSETERGTTENARYSFADPEAAVRCYLHSESQGCFRELSGPAVLMLALEADRSERPGLETEEPR